eukprot:CAMPEP_0179194136 /NCGR_PEP_ID=MMETSP0796-20121207/96487_1 /TAXON_ID=73915 /ORGANISM="Pyrodinium bahamense, Strain pbaha01" /LENGTH=52 /DNA_ID=CAMNT_0020898463 /DNA_START=127 /DNA_END=288 /DNA_ORIENTATION=-
MRAHTATGTSESKRTSVPNGGPQSLHENCSHMWAERPTQVAVTAANPSRISL